MKNTTYPAFTTSGSAAAPVRKGNLCRHEAALGSTRSRHRIESKHRRQLRRRAAGIVNFGGSYRFEMKFKAPLPRGGGKSPSAPEAMAAAIAMIADVKTPSELREGAPRTTYTVGRASCEPPPAGGTVVPSCSLEVDMRSTRKEPLEEIRQTIEPMFQAGATAENARYGRKDGSPEGITLELMWFGLRPAFVADSVDTVAIHAGLQSGIQLGVLTSPMVGTGSGSLNDNVPANTGIPTYQFTLAPGRAPADAFWNGARAALLPPRCNECIAAHGGIDRLGVPCRGRHRRAAIHRPNGQADARSRPITLEHTNMKRLLYSLAFVVFVAAPGTPAFAQQSGGLRVEFQGPGGHSSGAYGRVSALHAAARAVILIQKALPAGSYQITNLTGGNSVNSIASDGLIEMKLTAANAAAYQALVAAVTKAAAEGAAAENAFRGVKAGDLTSGAPATVRSVVTPF
jgi:metal-dependent amidase/aminoacylase/carboxypeptidase family protein